MVQECVFMAAWGRDVSVSPLYAVLGGVWLMVVSRIAPRCHIPAEARGLADIKNASPVDNTPPLSLLRLARVR